jgi:hypothetical protein
MNTQPAQPSTQSSSNPVVTAACVTAAVALVGIVVTLLGIVWQNHQSEQRASQDKEQFEKRF